MSESTSKSESARKLSTTNNETAKPKKKKTRKKSIVGVEGQPTKNRKKSNVDVPSKTRKVSKATPPATTKKERKGTTKTRNVSNAAAPKPDVKQDENKSDLKARRKVSVVPRRKSKAVLVQYSEKDDNQYDYLAEERAELEEVKREAELEEGIECIPEKPVMLKASPRNESVDDGIEEDIDNEEQEEEACLDEVQENSHSVGRDDNEELTPRFEENNEENDQHHELGVVSEEPETATENLEEKSTPVVQKDVIEKQKVAREKSNDICDLLSDTDGSEDERDVNNMTHDVRQVQQNEVENGDDVKYRKLFNPVIISKGYFADENTDDVDQASDDESESEYSTDDENVDVAIDDILSEDLPNKSKVNNNRHPAEQHNNYETKADELNELLQEIFGGSAAS